MIKVKPTTYDGIQFRSRLEAWWYAYLRMLGYSVQYEPETFELEYHSYADKEGIGASYMPDFLIEGGGWDAMYLEVKPDKPWSEYSCHDRKSLGCVCALGYEKKAGFVMGTPEQYYGFLVTDRYKGIPWGYRFVFYPGGNGSCIPRKAYKHDLEDYPDETDFTLKNDPRTYLRHLAVINPFVGIAKQAFNATRWEPK